MSTEPGLEHRAGVSHASILSARLQLFRKIGRVRDVRQQAASRERASENSLRVVNAISARSREPKCL